MEHRWGQRLSVRTRVGLRAGGARGIGYIRDVSMSGALVVTGMRPMPMSFVKVLLRPATSTPVASMEGHIVRCTDSGFAVEWCELAPDLMRSLVRTEVSNPIAAPAMQPKGRMTGLRMQTPA